MHRSSSTSESPTGATRSNNQHDTLTLGIFSRVNTSAKEIAGAKMYSEWASVQQTIEQDLNDLSVLNKFPLIAGRDVATPIVRHLASNLGISSNSHCEPSPLEDDKDVLWCMEVLSYGLSLPLTEHDTIRDSVNVYCEWLMALLRPKVCVPRPVCEDPNRYAQIMIKHFYGVFVPRTDANADAINRQVVLCHRVLRTLQKLAQESKSLLRETWESMLMLLLAVSDVLLAPPTVDDDIGDQLCERVVSVLFEVWLLACSHCFPSPSLWKTFRDICLNWRHRMSLVDQWNRVNLALTAKLLKFVYGPSFPELKIGDDDGHFASVEMSKDCVAQSWFRFLHLLGNPVELCYPAVVSNTPKFLHFAITSECVVDPCQHECLSVLPQVFLRAMCGVSVLVDAFLGVASYAAADEFHWESSSSSSSSKVLASATSALLLPQDRQSQQQQQLQSSSVTPPQVRKPAKSFSVTTTTSKGGLPKSSLIGGLTSAASRASSQSSVVVGHTPTASHQPHPFPTMTVIVADARPSLAPARPRCNSILHLFGAWLFEAALVGSRLPMSSRGEKAARPSSLVLESSRGSFHDSSSLEIPPELTVRQYESGRAEAVGALCRIFCSKKTGEDILPVYLARFYLALQQGLRMYEQAANGQVLCGIIMNSRDLLRLDLDGVMVIVPDLIDALELILPERELKFRASVGLSPVELRRASIHLLLSMLPLPLHFRSLPIKELLPSVDRPQQLRFQDLRPRLVNLLVGALQSETDSVNMQLLLGGLLLSIEDVATCEAEECVLLQQDGLADSASLLASDSTYALFVRATYLVCQRLGSSWKMDLNVSLAALELLSGFAKIKIPDQCQKLQETAECKLLVKWICDYIVNQCNRPPQFHSKDLHSNIVAAFRCIGTWLVEHPYLVRDPDCLGTVLGVVELGISGSKSHSKVGAFDVRCLKADKECKPASMRVRDAAECLLAYLMEHVGNFPSPSGQAALSSLLDEEGLLGHCRGPVVSRVQATQHFRYYVVDNSIVVALLEQPLGNDQDPQPTITVLTRGPFGRNVWTMQLRHLPRHKSGTKMHPSNPGRPLPATDHHVRHHVRQRFFPESVNAIQPCKAERSIPTLESLIVGKAARDHEKLSALVEQQVAFEDTVRKRFLSQKLEYPNPETECCAPEVRHEFETARLFLNHFGMLSLKHPQDSPAPPLMSLNAAQPGFAADLEALDAISIRTCDTTFVFYVKTGQKTVQQILDNATSARDVHPHFMEFLLSLGWPVDVHSHPGWTGHVSTSFKVSSESVVPPPPVVADESGAIPYDGQRQVLYWSDALAEIAFVVPSSSTVASKPSGGGSGTDDGGGFVRGPPLLETAAAAQHCEKPSSLSLDLDKGPTKDKESPSDGRGRKVGRQFSSMSGCDTKVLVVWLECFEDHLNVPLEGLLLETSTGQEGLSSSVHQQGRHDKDVPVIFVHALQSGLFRIKLQLGQTGNKISMAVPLMDGMVVGRRVLGSLVRQTVLNACLRKRLENDAYYPPHLRRKLRIQEIVHKYGHGASEPEFYSRLFETPTASN